MVIYTVDDLICLAGIDKVKSIDKEIIKKNDKVYLNEWARPILQNNNSVLLVEKIINNNNYEWRCATKEFVKGVSN